MILRQSTYDGWENCILIERIDPTGNMSCYSHTSSDYGFIRVDSLKEHDNIINDFYLEIEL